jgi:hypothetical protein
MSGKKTEARKKYKTQRSEDDPATGKRSRNLPNRPLLECRSQEQTMAVNMVKQTIMPMTTIPIVAKKSLKTEIQMSTQGSTFHVVR